MQKTILADFHAAFKDARALWDVYKNLYEILIFAVKIELILLTSSTAKLKKVGSSGS